MKAQMKRVAENWGRRRATVQGGCGRHCRVGILAAALLAVFLSVSSQWVEALSQSPARSGGAAFGKKTQVVTCHYKSDRAGRSSSPVSSSGRSRVPSEGPGGSALSSSPPQSMQSKPISSARKPLSSAKGQMSSQVSVRVPESIKSAPQPAQPPQSENGVAASKVAIATSNSISSMPPNAPRGKSRRVSPPRKKSTTTTKVTTKTFCTGGGMYPCAAPCFSGHCAGAKRTEIHERTVGTSSMSSAPMSFKGLKSTGGGIPSGAVPLEVVSKFDQMPSGVVPLNVADAGGRVRVVNLASSADGNNGNVHGSRVEERRSQLNSLPEIRPASKVVSTAPSASMIPSSAAHMASVPVVSATATSELPTIASAGHNAIKSLKSGAGGIPLASTVAISSAQMPTSSASSAMTTSGQNIMSAVSAVDIPSGEPDGHIAAAQSATSAGIASAAAGSNIEDMASAGSSAGVAGMNSAGGGDASEMMGTATADVGNGMMSAVASNAAPSEMASQLGPSSSSSYKDEGSSTSQLPSSGGLMSSSSAVATPPKSKNIDSDLMSENFSDGSTHAEVSHGMTSDGSMQVLHVTTTERSKKGRRQTPQRSAGGGS